MYVLILAHVILEQNALKKVRDLGAFQERAVRV